MVGSAQLRRRVAGIPSKVTRRILLAGLLPTVLVATWTMGPASAEPPLPPPTEAPTVRTETPDNPLDAWIVDAASVRDARVARLLTIADVGDRVGLRLIERDGRRWVQTSALATDRGGRGNPPWLIRVGPATFLMLHDLPYDLSTAITEIDASDGHLTAGRSATIAGVVIGAGAADVDGDGRPELIVADGRPAGAAACGATRVRMLDSSTLRVRSTAVVDDLALRAGQLADVGGGPGADLAAYGLPLCDPGREAQPVVRLVTLDLGSGTLLAPMRDAGPLPDSADAAGFALRAGDLDGDGQVELVVRDQGDLVALDPTRGWRRSVLADGDAQPISLASARGSRLPVLAWLDTDWLSIGPVLRRGEGFALAVPAPVGLAEAGADRWGRMVAAARLAGRAGGPPNATWLDLDEDGCDELILPLAIAWCTDHGSVARRTVRPGPAWTGTRPLLVAGSGDDARILVAEDVDWAAGRRLADPSPLAAWEAAGETWRTGPSGAFALSEVTRGELRNLTNFPLPAPAIGGPAGSMPPTAVVTGAAGTRVLLRVAPLGPTEAPHDPPATIATFLRGRAPFRRFAVHRIPVPAGHDSNVDVASASIPLGASSVSAADGPAADRWEVTYVALNVWGEASEPRLEVVTLDRTAPSLTVSEPFLSVPWPFTTRIAGVAEPGVTVTVDGGPRIEPNPRGRFELVAQLAPWPQTLTVRAIDAAGNTTVRRVSVVGGLDYRQLPLVWIAITLVLVVVTASTFRTPRRGARTVGTFASGSRHVVHDRTSEEWDPFGDPDGPEIEELPRGPGIDP